MLISLSAWAMVKQQGDHLGLCRLDVRIEVQMNILRGRKLSLLVIVTGKESTNSRIHDFMRFHVNISE